MSGAMQIPDRANHMRTRSSSRRALSVKSATLLEVVLEQMADGVIIADAAGRIRRVNPAAARMHGRVVTDIRPEDWSRSYDLLRPDGEQYPAEDLALTRALRRGDVVEGEEWIVRHPDGTLVRLLGSAAPLRDARGRQLGAVLVMRDITERERLTQTVREEKAAKEKFFAYMSHELRTPVNAVLGYSALLLDGMAGTLPPKAAHMIDRMNSSAHHLNALVDDLLDLGRLDAGKMQINIEAVALPVLLHDVLTSLEPQVRAKGLTLNLETADIPCVWTDAKRVRQIMLNLASNAIKFTDHGSVRVTIERLDSTGIAVHVTDTGIGIASEDMERVFDEFVQVGPGHGGTGLGLPISRRLARLLGGDLMASSASMKGSCFTLTLPWKPASMTAGEAPGK